MPVDTVVNETVLYILAAGNVYQAILIALNTSSRTILWAHGLGHAEAPTSIRARAVAIHGSTLYVLGEDADTGYVISGIGQRQRNRDARLPADDGRGLLPHSRSREKHGCRRAIGARPSYY